MPKIIENVKEQLLNEAKKQVAENGYGKTTIRSVANACGLGVGTVYNYFKSKDMLIASFMAEDWKKCILTVKSELSDEPQHVLEKIYIGLLEFWKKHQALFRDSDAVKVFATVFSERHRLLRSQLSDIIEPICSASSVEDKTFLADFIAESLLTWTIAGKSFSEQFTIINKLLK